MALRAPGSAQQASASCSRPEAPCCSARPLAAAAGSRRHRSQHLAAAPALAPQQQQQQQQQQQRGSLAVAAAGPKAAFASGPLPVSSKPVPYMYRDAEAWPTPEDTPLPRHDLEAQPQVDLVVAGAGPAGVAVACRVAEAGFSVCVVDPEPHAHWPNNYGVWVDEFQAMGLEDCLHITWPKAKVWLNSEQDGEKFLSRPFGRVDRPKLKRRLLEKCAAAGVTFLDGKVAGCSHGGGSSSVALADGRSVRGSLVLDATGHARKLVKFDRKFDPGYQGAYGIIAEVESHPFPLDTMLFMDWRDDHTHAPGLEAMRASNDKLPTFLYAMPFSPTKVFLEETSLVSRPALDFPELKERLDARLKWLGVQVKHVEEEEYCLIPMGGVLPVHPQRVIAIGGTAGMVHPSTGFMMARMLGSAPTVADAIVDQLSLPADKAANAGAAMRPSSEAEANAMAAAVWAATWPVERIRQRAFFNFGMDVLLSLNLLEIREFFRAFFSLSDFHWHGFLSTRLSFTQLIVFGLSLFLNASNQARSNLLARGLPGLVTMLAGLAPTLGGGYYKEVDTLKARKDRVDAAARQAKASASVAGSARPAVSKPPAAPAAPAPAAPEKTFAGAPK